MNSLQGVEDYLDALLKEVEQLVKEVSKDVANASGESSKLKSN